MKLDRRRLPTRPPIKWAAHPAKALTEVGDLIESGHITPVIDRAYPLTDAAAAVRLVEEGSPAGKVIVVVETSAGELPPC